MVLKIFQRKLAALICFALFILASAIYFLSQRWIEIPSAAFCLIVCLVSLHQASYCYREMSKYASSMSKRCIYTALRDERIFRPLANRLLRKAGSPTRIPAGAMDVLRLIRCDRAKDGSPLDWEVSWCQLDGHPKTWIWRRTDLALGTFQDSDKKWRELDLSRT